MQKLLFSSIVVLALVFVSPCHAQTKVVSGVAYTLNDLPVANLEIAAKKSGAAVLTDSLGNFSIVCEEKDVLLFKGKVFRREKKKIGKNDNYVEVELSFINTEENKEYAIGYGYIADKDKLNASAQIADRNTFCSYSSVLDAIEGRFTNVQVHDDCVVIRGTNSIKSNSCAIYVVNGQLVQSIANIDPCMVESLDIIKDGTAAIYGMQGANGVIIIELVKSIQ